MATLAGHLSLPAGGAWVLLGLAVFLAMVTAYRFHVNRRRPAPSAERRVRSVATWWLLLAVLIAALALGRAAVIFAILAISLLGLREGLRLAGVPGLYPWAVGAATAVYAWSWFDPSTLYLRALPPVIVLLAAVALRRRGVALVLLGTVLGPSYTVAVASLPAPSATSSGTAFGALLLLLLLTEVHDSAQAWWGRALGSRSLAPRLSPGKTWEGLWGGLATTAGVAALCAPLLLPPLGTSAEERLLAGGVGLAVGLAGTAGDLAASSLKRTANVKDSGDIVPGHGGVIDRFDSLAATAPVFFLLAQLGMLGGFGGFGG